jgi:Na+-transporting NADH:ubiquinone oxidoreductase subunit A
MACRAQCSLAADPSVVIADSAQDFHDGLTILSKLFDGNIHVCKAPGSSIPSPEQPRFVLTEFAGPHPAGLVGTHIHFLDPVNAARSVWHIGYQDVIAVGRLFVTGELSVERIVALAGPVVRQPRLLRTRLGASTEDLVVCCPDPCSTVAWQRAGHATSGATTTR